MESFEFRTSLKKTLPLTLVCLAFAGGGVFMLHDKARGGWLVIVFFGAGVLVCLWHLIDRRARIVVDEFGVYDRKSGVGRIAWGDIANAYRSSINSQVFICLEVQNEGEYLRKAGMVKRFLAVSNRWLGFTPLLLNLALMNVNPDELLGIVLAFKRRAEETRGTILK